MYSAFGTSKAVSAICFDFTICPVCSDKIFRTLRKLTYVHTPTHVNILGTPFSSSTFGTRLAVIVTTTDHTYFHSRPHSNATSFLQCNKGVGFPGSFGPTITGWHALPSNTWGKHLKISVGERLTNHSAQRWTMCSHCVTSLGSNWLQVIDACMHHTTSACDVTWHNFFFWDRFCPSRKGGTGIGGSVHPIESPWSDWVGCFLLLCTNGLR